MTTTLALALRPWRAFATNGPSPPWPWFALWALLPLLWSTDRIAQAPLLQPLSAAPLLVLMAGWPLAVLVLHAAGAAMWLGSDMGVAEALHRVVWLGVVPGTLSLAIGLAVRRLLPRQPFVYILGRAFFGTWIALALAGALALLTLPELAQDRRHELLIARGLAASAEAVLTGMLVSIFVAYRPQWLATWSDRLYLPSG